MRAFARRPPQARRWGLSVGAGMIGFTFGELESVHAFCAADGEFNPDGLLDDRFPADPVAFCRSQTNAGLGLLTRHFGIHGYATAVHTACASGGQALGTALKVLRRGHADFMLAGGYDSMLNPIGLSGFCLLGALSTDNDTPERASRPFDATRNGFVLGEGAGFLVLEDWDAGHGTRRAHLRRVGRRRQFAEQLSHHRLASLGRRSHPGHAAGAGRCRAGARGCGLRQCARHIHADE